MTKATLMILGVIVSFAGCSSAKLDSYVSPSYSAGQVRRVAVMPISNQRIDAGQAIELNRAFIQELQRRHPRIEVIGGQEAIAALNRQNQADLWANFLVGYSTSGLPNTRTLSTLAETLNVDAVVQGAMLRVIQEDSNGWNYPLTQVNIRYTMFGGKDWAVLWELTGEGKVQPYGYAAAPVFEAAKLAHDKILKQLPF